MALKKFGPRLLSAFVAAASLAVPLAAGAQVVTSWTSPADGTTFETGATVSLFGNANASGIVGGTGLDLALVLDSSGSMATVVSGQSRNAWLREASIALVNALPQGSTSVTVVDFDSVATTLQPLTPLSTGSASVVGAINRVNAVGGTNIGVGIDRATSELTGPLSTPSRVQMMVVVSDGESSGNPPARAAAALGAGVEAVHSVGIPGHSVPQMSAIATSGNGIYTNASDLSALSSLFDGTGGNLVGIDRIDIAMNDGSFLSGVAFDGLGNFTLNATILEGVNTFVVTAFDAVGNSASATLTLIGGDVVGAIPEPETYALMLAGLIAVAVVRRRRRVAADAPRP